MNVEIEDIIFARAEEHPRSAKNELEFLKRVAKAARAPEDPAVLVHGPGPAPTVPRPDP